MDKYSLSKEIFNDLNGEVTQKDISFILSAIVRELSFDLISNKKLKIHGLGDIFCKIKPPKLQTNQITVNSESEKVKFTKGKNLMFMNLSKEIRDFLKEAGGYGKTED